MSQSGQEGRKSLAKNTIMLYILTFSNFFFSFITVPYQTRVLGPETYGVIGFAFAVIVYFQLVMDFGFMLSGTAEIAKRKDDKRELAIIFESIIGGKVVLFALCAFVMAMLCAFVPQFSQEKTVFWLCLVYTFMNSLIPDFLYRGLEDMKPITVRTVLVKLIFTVGIFVFIREESDYVFVPVMYLIGSAVAVVFAYLDVNKRFGLKFVRITFSDVLKRLKWSFPFFVSRIASTVTGAMNTLLIGLQYSGAAVVGHYSSADKVVMLAKQGAAPISDSLYPYLIKNKDFKLVKKILGVIMPIILLGAAILFVYAEPICVLLFGEEYVGAADILRCLIPVIVFVLPNYIFGFPMMTPLGIERYANLAVVIGALFQVSVLFILYVTGLFSIIALCVTTSFTEIVIFMTRFVIVLKAMRKEKSNGVKTTD